MCGVALHYQNPKDKNLVEEELFHMGEIKSAIILFVPFSY